MSTSDTRPKFYLTTPIYYANARPHVGTTYSTLVADTIARLKRMQGYDVAFVTGTDEHGENIARAAAKAGITPKEFVDRNSAIFRGLWDELGITYTHFVRTTAPEHLRAVRRLLLKARDAGYIYKKFYEGRYCIFDNAYISETTEPMDCPLCGRPGEIVSEENYFFKLSAFQERLLKLYEDQPDFIRPAFRKNEIARFVEAGLRDISVSRRTVKWGLPWPEDPEHVIYVWYDALTSYLSGIGYGDDELQYEKYWPARLHLIGKEIIRFHCVYWPAFLWAAGEQLPESIFAHGWLLFDAEKMSKSKGNVAYAEPVARTLGVDALRYYLLREVSFGQDGNFSHDALVTRYNSDLANGLGNLASRTLTMIEQYCGGVVPRAAAGPASLETTLTNGIWEVIGNKEAGLAGYYNVLDFSRALESAWRSVAQIDNYLTMNAPWKLAKDPANQSRVEAILYEATESLRIILVLVHPVLPNATQRIWEQFGFSGGLHEQRIDQLAWGQLKGGSAIAKGPGVFPRVDHKEALERMATMEQDMLKPPSAKETAAPAATTAPPAAAAAAGAAPAAAPGVPARITIDDFAKVEMRVGLVKSAERVAGADKLMQLMVDIGDEVRQIVAGIATAYTPEQLVGRKVAVVVNLAPRKLRGVESNGMIMAATDLEGKPVLVSFLEEAPVGARLK